MEMQVARRFTRPEGWCLGKNDLSEVNASVHPLSHRSGRGVAEGRGEGCSLANERFHL